MISIPIFRRLRSALLAIAALLVLGAAFAPSVASAADYVPGEVVVGYAPGAYARAAADVQTSMGVRAIGAEPAPQTQVLQLPQGEGVWSAIASLRVRPGVAFAVPNYIAHEAGTWIPDDRGLTHYAGGWEQLQWNFLAPEGVNAPEAWSNLIADKRPGGRGVRVAIVDTGVAYRDWHQFLKSPDFAGTRFVDPYDFVADNRYPLDRNGHGTFVAGTVAEATNNVLGLTGLAYGVSIMPVRVLGANGSGDAATISRGIRYAASHGAQVINLSLEFDPGVTSADIPDIVSAIGYAHRRGVVVVAASGNEGAGELAYPARVPDVISVGATTRDGCLANYSNGGPGLDLVAPGGGRDADVPGEPQCHPGRPLPSIYQMTFVNPFNPRRFGFPGGWYGTSMSAPHVAATAALVIASRVLGRRPTPAAILLRLEQTARPIGGSTPNESYGYGLLNAGAATAPIRSS